MEPRGDESQATKRLHRRQGTGSVCCKAWYVLDLTHGLDQKYLIERETILQNS